MNAEGKTRLVVSCIVDPGPAHDRIRVWVRGQNVGTLTVGAGDGEAVASRLVRPAYPGLEPQGERIDDGAGRLALFEPVAGAGYHCRSCVCPDDELNRPKPSEWQPEAQDLGHADCSEEARSSKP